RWPEPGRSARHRVRSDTWGGCPRRGPRVETAVPRVAALVRAARRTRESAWWRKPARRARAAAPAPFERVLPLPRGWCPNTIRRRAPARPLRAFRTCAGSAATRCRDDLRADPPPARARAKRIAPRSRAAAPSQRARTSPLAPGLERGRALVTA